MLVIKSLDDLKLDNNNNDVIIKIESEDILVTFDLDALDEIMSKSNYEKQDCSKLDVGVYSYKKKCETKKHMIIDIFIKTYPNDHAFLNNCLLHIAKHVFGYRYIIIVTDSNTETIKIPQSIQNKTKLIIEPVLKVPETSFKGAWWRKAFKFGYCWQQIIKLNWTKYTDADYCVQVDSDMLFTKRCDLSKQMFLNTENNNNTASTPIWLYDLWQHSGLAKMWQPGTDYFFKHYKTKYETMCDPGFIMSRLATDALHKFCFDTHGLDIQTIFLNSPSPMSEYNIFGNFLAIFNFKTNKIDVNKTVNNGVIKDITEQQYALIHYKHTPRNLGIVQYRTINIHRS